MRSLLSLAVKFFFYHTVYVFTRDKARGSSGRGFDKWFVNLDGDFGRNRMEIIQNMKKRDRTELNLQNLTVFLQIFGGNCGNMSGVLRCSYEKR